MGWEDEGGTGMGMGMEMDMYVPEIFEPARCAPCRASLVHAVSEGPRCCAGTLLMHLRPRLLKKWGP